MAGEHASVARAVRPASASTRRSPGSAGWMACGLTLCVLVGVLCLEPFRVRGVSMLPELENRQHILVDRLVFRWREVRRGDVVVLRMPGDPARHLVKRVVGLPGECVAIRDGAVYVNGRRLAEPYLSGRVDRAETRPMIEVARGHYYVLGDHRVLSSDSRAWGLIPARSITGRAVLSYWPLGRAGRVH